MLRFFGFRKRERDDVIKDAETLIARYGTSAYEEARTRARDAHSGKVLDLSRSVNHWDKVRAEIGRRLNRQGVDTATRYLEQDDK
jgi:hypothetical protein